MKATRFEFRFRYIIHVVIFSVCFIAPWDAAWMHGRASSLWSAASMQLARTGAVSFGAVSVGIALLAILLAYMGAWLRTWGGAYLGEAVVRDSSMHGAAIMADGPYRRMRNPLYLGTWLHTLALALVMSPAGGVAAILLIGLFQLRLIFAEEAFLAEKLGAPYVAYCARVPRLLPSIKPLYPASGAPARWLPAMVTETYFWLFAISFSVLAWRYDPILIDKSLLFSLGTSMVLNAVFPARRAGRAQQA